MIGLNFISVGSGVEEIDSASNPVLTVKRNALAKSREVAFKFQKEIVIGADTIVVLGKHTLNKPANLKQAKDYLRRLSGKKHTVYTGVNVINTSNGNEIFGYEKTVVQFRDLTNDEIDFYVKKFRPLDKAGAYGIQDDFGAVFIKKINGCYYNVVGLPLAKFYHALLRAL